MAASIWRGRGDPGVRWSRCPASTSRDAKGSRPRVDDRICFNAIVFVLFTGVAWPHPSARDGLLAGDRAPTPGRLAEGQRL